MTWKEVLDWEFGPIFSVSIGVTRNYLQYVLNRDLVVETDICRLSVTFLYTSSVYKKWFLTFFLQNFTGHMKDSVTPFLVF